MKTIKMVLVAAIMALSLSALAGSAMATTITPANTNVTGTSTDSVLTTSTSSIFCNSSTATGNTGSTSLTTVTINITLAYSGCTAFGFVGATVVPSCTSGSFQLAVMSTGGGNADTVVTMPTSCKVTVTAGSCVVTFNGHQTIRGAYTASNETLSLNQSNLDYNSNGAAGCPSSGTHSDGTLTGNYTFSPTITIH